MDLGKGVGTQPKAAGVNYTLLPWFSLLLHSVKYEQETVIQHQQIKELSREHNVCSSNEVVVGCYDGWCFISLMYLQQITVKIG